VSPMSALQLSRIFELDDLVKQVRQNPESVNFARLKTALEALEVIQRTPFVSSTEADYLIQTVRRDFEKEIFPSEGRQRTRIFQNGADFGQISTFVDLVSHLITDDTIHTFFRTLRQRGRESLCSDLVKRGNGGGRSSKRKDASDVYIGISNFVDLAADLSDFLANIENQAFERSILKCLEPWFVSDLEPFCRSVAELVKEAIFADTAVDQDNEQGSLIWEQVDAKLAAVRDLVQRVHQQRQQAQRAVPTARAYGSDVLPVSVIAQEAHRVVERLSLLDAERIKLADLLNELEIAERVLSRFGGKADTADRRRRGRPARTEGRAGGQRRPRGGEEAPSVSLSDATLKAVQAHGEGATANEVMNYLSREFGMTVSPNNLGIALQRHRRAGRLENRDQRWFLPHSREESEGSAMIA
jgi:hypothetical protein